MAEVGSADWRAEQLDRLLTWGRRARTDQGFGWLRDDGTVDPDRPLELWINARMTYVWATAHRLGHAGAADLAAHGVHALATVFEDDEHGGWSDQPDGRKDCYAHDFVLLAGAAAASTEVEGGAALLERAQRIHVDRFWDADVGLCVESWDRDWTKLEDYRGANSNMHAVEAYLATAAVTGDDVWVERATSIAGRLIGAVGRAHDWRVVEHFDAGWTPALDLNRDRVDDPFRPFGSTPGHGFEWARLMLELAAVTDSPPGWLVESAEALFERAVADAVDDDHPLLPYTVDWTGAPVVGERFHWVMAEAVQAAEALARATDRALYDGLAQRWWSEIDDHLVADDGSWVHELSADLRPSHRTWAGRPDVYHAFNALRPTE